MEKKVVSRRKAWVIITDRHDAGKTLSVLDGELSRGRHIHFVVFHRTAVAQTQGVAAVVPFTNPAHSSEIQHLNVVMLLDKDCPSLMKDRVVPERIEIRNMDETNAGIDVGL